MKPKGRLSRMNACSSALSVSPETPDMKARLVMAPMCPHRAAGSRRPHWFLNGKHWPPAERYDAHICFASSKVANGPIAARYQVLPSFSTCLIVGLRDASTAGYLPCMDLYAASALASESCDRTETR